MISNTLAYDLQRFLLTVLMVSGPVVVAAFLVGILVGIAQAVTQVQDQSIAYGVKIVVVIVILMLLGDWMAQQVLILFDRAFEWIIVIGHAKQ